MDATALATWVPVSLSLDGPSPSIDWGDLGERRFAEPFFQDTLTRWATTEPRAQVTRTDLRTLAALDEAASLDPVGFIFHSSRCGSTLLARLMRQIPGCVVVAEADIVNTVLRSNRDALGDFDRAELLRLVIRALGRRRLGDERHYVVKLSSWNVCSFAVFRRAFPACACIWLQRQPAEVLRSLLASKPAWATWRDKPELAAAMFQIDRGELSSLAEPAFYVRALTAMLRAAAAAAPHFAARLDYGDLPQAAWTVVAPRFGMAPDADAIRRMQAEARYDAKEAAPRVFEPERAAPIPQAVERLASTALDELYKALSARPANAPSLPR